jgi:hypothetical protein
MNDFANSYAMSAFCNASNVWASFRTNLNDLMGLFVAGINTVICPAPFGVLSKDR